MDIVSYLTVENYSKFNEYFCFLLFVLVLPSIFGFSASFIFPSKNNSTLNSIKSTKFELFFCCFVIPFLIYFCLYRSSLHGTFDMYHEGEMLVPAQMFMNGSLPYKDFYLQHGLIRNCLMPFFAMILYGESVEAVRKFFHQIEPLSYIAFYFTGLLLFKGRCFFKAMVSLLLVLICSSYFYWIGLRQGLMLVSLNFILLAVRKLDNSEHYGAAVFYFFLSGLSAAFCFWFSVEYGVYCLASTFSIAILFRLLSSYKLKRIVLSYLFGVFLFSFPILLWLGSYSLLEDFNLNLYQQLFYQSLTWGYPFPSFIISDSKVVRMYFSVLVLSFFCAYLVWNISSFKKIKNKELLCVFVFAFFCFRTALGRSDYGHWIDGSTLIFLLLFMPFSYHFFMLSVKKTQRFLSFFIFTLFVFFLFTEHQVVNSIQNRVRKYGVNKRVEIKKPLEKLGAVYIPKTQRAHILNVINYINSNLLHEGDLIYDFSNQAAYYFLADLKSPSRYFQVSYAVTPFMQKEVVSNLEQKKPKIVIFNSGTTYDAIDGVFSEKRHAIIYKYLIDNYEIAKKINTTTLLKRKL